MKQYFNNFNFSALLALLFICLSANTANAQRLDSRDTSRLADNTIFATQDTSLSGTYRWSQTPYSVLRDSLYYHYTPTRGMVFGDEAAYLESPQANPNILANQKRLNRVLTVGSTGFITQSNAANGSYMSLTSRSMNANGGSILDLSSYSHLSDGNRILLYWADTTEVFRGISHYPNEGRRFFDLTGAIYSGASFKSLSSIQFHTLEAFSATNMPTVMQFLTTKRNATSRNETLVLNKYGNGKWYGENYTSGWAKFENGVLQEKTAVELLEDVAPALPVYADNASAVNALGTDKLWRDAIGFVRVTY